MRLAAGRWAGAISAIFSGGGRARPCMLVRRISSSSQNSYFAQFTPTLSSLDVAKLTNAQKNLLIWEQAERPDYQVGIADLLDISRKEQDTSTLLVSAQFLQKTLPPMLAKRIKDLQALPLPFQETGGSIGRMCTLFEETFLHVLHSKPVTSVGLEEEFSTLLVMAKAKHLEIGQNISEALRNIRCSGNGEWVDATGNLLYVDEAGKSQVQEVFGRFYNGRIGIRLLVDTHLALRRDVLGDTLKNPEQKAGFEYGSGPLGHADYQRYVWARLRELESEDLRKRKYFSVLHPKCKINNLVMIAIEDAKVAAARDISEACGHKIVDDTVVEFEGDMDVVIPMIPEHLYLITTEIVANALRANAERHGPHLSHSQSALPPIRVTQSKGQGHFFLKVSDQGGGIAFENTSKIWKFSYSAGHFRYQGDREQSLDISTSRISRQGLPLSRLYARYWGGDVTVTSMENWGSDFLLRIPLVALPGQQMILPSATHDDPLNRGFCVREKCAYPFAFWNDEASRAHSGTSLFTAPLN